MSPVSRRAFVLTPVAAAGSILVSGLVTGCTDEPPPAPVDPDRLTLLAALDREQTLLAQSLSWKGEAVPAAEVRRVVQIHVDRLASTVGTSVTPTPTTSLTPTGTPVVAAPSTVEFGREADRVADEHTRVISSAGVETAQLLASLAASDAALAAYLRAVARTHRTAQ